MRPRFPLSHRARCQRPRKRPNVTIKVTIKVKVKVKTEAVGGLSTAVIPQKPEADPAVSSRRDPAVLVDAGHGGSYLGICAGAFFAGRSPYNGLNLTSGVQFGFYSAEARGVRKAAVPISGAGTPTLDQYWEDGPQLTGWGDVVGRYPDGTPAVVQGQSGDGWIILTGVHPEAPESWRGGMDFTTPASVDHAYAVTLIRSALERRPLSHF